MIRRLILTVAAGAALVAGLSGSALADDSFGQQVAMCAHETLGPGDNPPAVTCSHDGMTMTFANFGEMVQHMKVHDG